MPDTTARPLVHGKRDPGSRVETLATHGLVMIALLGQRLPLRKPRRAAAGG